MSDSFWMSFFTFLTTLGLGYLQLRTARDVAEVKHETNSMKDRLVAVTRSDALQEGAATERKRQTE